MVRDKPAAAAATQQKSKRVFLMENPAPNLHADLTPNSLSISVKINKKTCRPVVKF